MSKKVYIGRAAGSGNLCFEPEGSVYIDESYQELSQLKEINRLTLSECNMLMNILGKGCIEETKLGYTFVISREEKISDKEADKLLRKFWKDQI